MGAVEHRPDEKEADVISCAHPAKTKKRPLIPKAPANREKYKSIKR